MRHRDDAPKVTAAESAACAAMNHPPAVPADWAGGDDVTCMCGRALYAEPRVDEQGRWHWVGEWSE